jgi:hypothetical protein
MIALQSRDAIGGGRAALVRNLDIIKVFIIPWSAAFLTAQHRHGVDNIAQQLAVISAPPCW